VFDYLEGQIVEHDAMRLVVHVGTTGGAIAYSLRVPLGTFARVEQHGGFQRVYVLTCAQDDLPRLFGFATKTERDLCRLLLKVAGVGPSLALALLSADSPDAILGAIEREDVKMLTTIKGIGAKTAKRLCLEIKEQAGAWLKNMRVAGTPTPARAADPVRDDAVLALASLGYSTTEAEERVDRARGDEPDADVETVVKAALRSPATARARRAAPRGRQA